MISKTQERVTPRFFKVKCTYLEYGGRILTKPMLKIPSEPYKNDLRKFIHDNLIHERIEKSATAMDLNVRQMLTVSVRLGDKGTPLTVVLHEWSGWMQ